MINASADHGGVSVFLLHGSDESAHMMSDRAWLVARTLSTDPFATPKDAGTAALLWAWWSHAGCMYGVDQMRMVAEASRRSHVTHHR